MTTTFVDLRKKSGEIIRALRRKERITLLYRGKPAAIIQPIDPPHADILHAATAPPQRAQDHAAFGLWGKRRPLKDVPAYVRRLRRGRLDAL
jgi:antitoxin (DNA-binding transcriptional repressor) of toxin-antitoxin stability system